MLTYGFLHLAGASVLRLWTLQFPWLKTGALRLPSDRIAVAAECSVEQAAFSISAAFGLSFRPLSA
jgi:hypothetical protein